MSHKSLTGRHVFDEALRRLNAIYAGGHTVVVSFSAGKDSGVCLELAIIAARQTGRLPVTVVMRDEEIMFPGTFEYAARVAQRKEVAFRWLVARQPIVNFFNRSVPYWWVFDDRLPPSSWVREFPPFAEEIPEKNIKAMITRERFPTDRGKDIYAVIGLRGDESPTRMYAIHSSKGHLTKPNDIGVRYCRPIYDWKTSDVWKAVHENDWDYNRAYDVMFRYGVDVHHQRIAPPTLARASIHSLGFARAAWPRWFDRVEARLPGAKTAAMFGMIAVSPHRRKGESWEECYRRECIEDAPTPWIAERSRRVMDAMVRMHAAHSRAPFPDVHPCPSCLKSIGSWRALSYVMYNGDPFAMRTGTLLEPIDPEYFRENAGKWNGKPTW